MMGWNAKDGNRQMTLDKRRADESFPVCVFWDVVCELTDDRMERKGWMNG